MGFLSANRIPILFLILMSVSFYSGWKVHSYRVGYQQNLEKIVQESIDKSVSEFQKKQAQGLEDTKKLLANAKTNTILKENTIVNQPIYMNKCMEQQGVELLEDYKKESYFIINKGAKK